MLQIEEWLKDKPIDIATLALQSIITYDRALQIILAKIKNQDELFDLSDKTINVKDWLLFYRKHRKLGIWSAAKSLASLGIKPPNYNSNSIEKSTVKSDPKSELFYKESNNFFNPREFDEFMYEFTLEMYEEEIKEDTSFENFTPRIPETFREPEYLFFLKVVTPCYLVYGEFPAILLRKARRGDIKALDKILRVDKFAISDPFIIQQFNLASQKDKSKFEVMSNALRGSIQGKVSRQKIKSIIAAIISLTSERFGHRFTSTDIKELFDAVAVDRGLDELIDPDLPDSPEAFSQAILRERRNIRPFF